MTPAATLALRGLALDLVATTAAAAGSGRTLCGGVAGAAAVGLGARLRWVAARAALASCLLLPRRVARLRVALAALLAGLRCRPRLLLRACAVAALAAGLGGLRALAVARACLLPVARPGLLAVTRGLRSPLPLLIPRLPLRPLAHV